MKKIIAAAAISTFVASSAFAGSMEAPVMEDKPMVETVEETSGSSASGIVVPLMALLLLGVAASN
jgi:hypothetical protein